MQDISLPNGCTQNDIDRAFGAMPAHVEDALNHHRAVQKAIADLKAEIEKFGLADDYEELLGELEDNTLSDEQVLVRLESQASEGRDYD